MRLILASVALLLILAACGTNSDDSTPTEEPSPSTITAPAVSPDAEGTASEPPASQTPATAEIEPLRATPALPEGPYYPSEAQRPSDRDSDLLLLTGSPAIASGEPLLLDGQLLDTTGSPVRDATIELWQTDVQGIYLHPDDPRTNSRDAYFQSYGETITDQNGTFSFRTVVPAPYDDRPRHLHVKVTLDGVELLTTQVFFAGDAALATDSITAGLGPALDAVSITTSPGVDEAGLAVQRATRIIVVEPSS